MHADAIPGALAILIPQWLAHLVARGKRANTLKAYGADLDRFRAYAARHDITLVQLVSERLLNRWIDDGLLHLGWSPRTAARRLAAACTFLRWCRGEGYLDHDPAEHVHVRFRARRVIAPELAPLKGVIAAIGTRTPLDLRDRAMLLLLLDAALRAGELVMLDIPTDAAPIPVHCANPLSQRVYVRPKGGADDEADVIGMEPQTVAALQAWMRARPKLARDGEPALFVNQRGTRLGRQGLYVTVRKRGAAAGLPKLHPHLFRHRRVGDVVEKLGLDVGRALARHRHTATTANVYGAHAAEVQRAAIRTLAPLGEIRA